jgi:hypothetical protein
MSARRTSANSRGAFASRNQPSVVSNQANQAYTAEELGAQPQLQEDLGADSWGKGRPSLAAFKGSIIEHIKDSPMKLNITRKFEIGGDSAQTSGFQLLRAGPSDYQRKVI